MHSRVIVFSGPRHRVTETDNTTYEWIKTTKQPSWADAAASLSGG